MAKPYPAELVRRLTLVDGTRVVVRPIRPEDRQIEKEFVEALSNESKYFRFMSALRELNESMLNRFTQIDYDQEMALIAVVCENARETEIGVTRYIVSASGSTCEFALAVADAWQQRGVGTILLCNLIDAARARGLKTMEGSVMTSNNKMLGLVRALGFNIQSEGDNSSIKLVTKQLAPLAISAVGISDSSAADVDL